MVYMAAFLMSWFLLFFVADQAIVLRWTTLKSSRVPVGFITIAEGQLPFSFEDIAIPQEATGPQINLTTIDGHDLSRSQGSVCVVKVSGTGELIIGFFRRNSALSSAQLIGLLPFEYRGVGGRIFRTNEQAGMLVEDGDRCFSAMPCGVREQRLVEEHLNLMNEQASSLDFYKNIRVRVRRLCCNFCCFSATPQKNCLDDQNNDASDTTDNANNRGPKIAAVELVLSWIVWGALFLIMCWSAFIKAPCAFADSRDLVGVWYTILFLMCFALCVMFWA